jgi:two-component system nitrogen regulation response regulator GlnG/two-component system response regulator HydG
MAGAKDQPGQGNTPDSSTLEESSLAKDPSSQGQKTAFALVLVWCRADSSRLGDALLIPTNAKPNRIFFFGRGISDEGDGERLHLVRQRPGQLQRMGPFGNPWISRRQLMIRVEPGQGLRVENVGRCEMRVRGTAEENAIVRVGDTIFLHNQLLFYCTEWPMPSRAGVAYPSDRVPSFGDPDPDGIVGESPVAWRLRDQIEFAATRSGHVLLLGASGTGKELVANAIHNMSARRGKPLIARNAATFPEGLIDAELFGNLKDYPNPGTPARPGLIGAADGSTLFLDEIGELPVELQAHLLRVLDAKGEYQRLGEVFSRNSDLRLIAATNRSLNQLKTDLAARLKLRITVPDLNGRREDIPFLARHLLRRAATDERDIAKFFEGSEGDCGELRITADLMEALVRRRYTANVRELENLLWQSVATSEGDQLRLTRDVREELKLTTSSSAIEPPRTGFPSRDAVQECLQRNQGVRERAWRELGLKNRHVLNRLIKKYEL